MDVLAFLARFGESLRGNRIGATGLRPSERKSASERVSERVSEREGFQRFLRGLERFLEVFRDFERFQRFLEVLRDFFRGFQRFLRGFQRSSQRPSQRQISSQRLSVLLPLIVLPLELSPNDVRNKMLFFVPKALSRGYMKKWPWIRQVCSLHFEQNYRCCHQFYSSLHRPEKWTSKGTNNTCLGCKN